MKRKKLDNNYIPYGKQKVTSEDIKVVSKVLKSDFLTQGPIGEIFESRISEKLLSNFSVAFNSATSALHAACLSLGVGSGDYVWTSPNTFVASANLPGCVARILISLILNLPQV